MPILWALILGVVMPLSTFVPGFALARKLRLGVDEKLCASIGLSVLVLHLIATILYFLPVPWVVAWAITIGVIICTWQLRRDIRDFLSHRRIRQQLTAFGCLLMVGLLIVSAIRHYSGGVWSGDWLEHFERTRFFLERWPYERLFIGLYPLPARPPLMNLLAGYFMGHLERSDFGAFQVIFLYLNLLILFPCVLLAGNLVKFGSRKVWLIAGVLALSPVVMQHATFTWTKLFSAFFVVMSLAFYLRGWRRNDPGRMFLSAGMMAGGLLVHYSAGPYALVLIVHYLLIARRRSHMKVEIAGAILVGGLVLLTWLGWAVVVYGVDKTFASNTSVADARKLTVVENAAKIGRNVYYTVVPRPLRTDLNEFRGEFAQPNPFGVVRDYFFTIYQGNAFGAMGLGGWVGVLWIAWRGLHRAPGPRRRFWLGFVIAGVLVAVSSHGGEEQYGLTSVVLVPVVVIGLTALAAGLNGLAPQAKGTLVLLLALDAVLGLLLQHRMQTHDFQLLPADAPAMEQAVPFSPHLLSVTAVWNSVLKHRVQVQFFGDILSPVGSMLFVLLALMVTGWLWSIARQANVARIWRYAAISTCALGATIVSNDGTILSESTSPPEITSAQQAADSAPESASTRYQLGRAYYDARQLQPAAAQLIDASLLDPYLIEPRYLLRMMLLTHGAFVEDTDAWAAEVYRRNPTDPVAIRRLAELLDQHGYPDAARRRRAELR